LRPNIELRNPKEKVEHQHVEEAKIYKREKKSRIQTQPSQNCD